MPDFTASRSSVHEERKYQVRLLGTGAANPVTEIGQGVVVTRTAVGVFRVAWPQHPGNFIRFGWAFGGVTSANLKGQTVTRGVPTLVAGQITIDLSLWSSAFAADELLATEYLDLEFVFSAVKIPFLS